MLAFRINTDMNSVWEGYRVVCPCESAREREEGLESVGTCETDKRAFETTLLS